MKLVIFLFYYALAWDYSSNGGDWTGTCSSGGKQSPINIKKSSASSLGSKYSMEVYYYGKTGSRTVSNNGNYIYIESDFGYITVTDSDGLDRKFLTDYIIFHRPSEHQFNGHSSQMELQIYHTVSDSDYTVDFPKRAVVSVMIRPGDFSYFFDAIEVDNLPSTMMSNVLPSNSNVNLLGIVDPSDDYFMYSGSLTMPDCEENVLWYIFETEQGVSFEQMNYFNDTWSGNPAFKNGNVRSLQSRNGRTIRYSYSLEYCISSILLFFIINS